MTPPIPGQVYERDGLRREVLSVIGSFRLQRIRWQRPGSGKQQECWIDQWSTWASKAALVETKHETYRRD